MPPRPLPNNPSLEHLRKEAKRLRAAVSAGTPDALAVVNEFHPRADRAVAHFTLADAQLAIARSYGFASWTKLKEHLREIEPFVWTPPGLPDPNSRLDVFLQLACLTYSGLHPSPERARRMLVEDPELARADIYAAAAAGDVTAVGAMLDRDRGLLNRKGGPFKWEPLLYACYSRIDTGRSSGSTLDVARLLISRGADPDAGFLMEGSYAFTALTGAFGRGEDWPNQPPHPDCDALARLLLEAGADPNDAQTLYNRHFRENDDHLALLFEYGLGGEKGGPWITRLNDPLFNPSSLLVIELGWAAQHGFAGRVRLLLDHGVDVNARTRRSDRTPYEEAIRAGHQEIAEYLLQRGAVKVVLDPRESFAAACIAGNHDEVRARLGADPSLLDRLGHEGRMDMLHRAVDAKQPAGIRLIVGLGVDINGMVPGTGMDRTVLHNTAGWGGVEMVKLLLELGADPNLRDLTYQGTAIGWAMYNGQRDVVEYLLPSASIFDAVRAGSVDRVLMLLEQDPSLAHARGPEGKPVAFYLNPDDPRVDEMIRLLAARGVDLNARDSKGRTIADVALSLGLTEFVDVLRAHGAATGRV
jgi:ankyrin repeat protein